MTNQLWQPARKAAQTRLDTFLPSAGKAYAARRNFDFGPEDRSNVSALSPWVRHRVISEEAIISQVLQIHSLDASEKFVQEVAWRTYWKGWLEHRPSIWRDYRAKLNELRRTLDDDPALQSRYDAAIEGRTGIDCFDHWAQELIDHGWLHNHARMWFASIWIFTLKLPWQLGAAFFYRHLLDGDPASNTLSWRWVAGLQTIGKTYLARASNIEKFTAGRFNPVDQLTTEHPVLPSIGHPLPRSLPPVDQLTPLGDLFDLGFMPKGNVGLLAHLEDLSPQDHCDLQTISAVAILIPGDGGGLSDKRHSFLSGLITDLTTRLSACETHNVPTAQAVVAWAKSSNVDHVLIPFAPTGPTGDKVADIIHVLRASGVETIISQRRWDHAFYPHTKKGFFNMRSKIPAVLSDLAITK